MMFVNWKDCCADSYLWLLENTASLDTTNKLDQSASEACIKKLEANLNLVALELDQITDMLVLLRYISRIGRIVKKKPTKKNEKVVALHGFGTSDAPVRFKSSSVLLDQRIIVTTNVPSNDDFETFENVSSFKHLISKKENIRSF